MSENTPQKPSRARAALFALAVACLLLPFTHRMVESQNDLSRLVGVESLALRGHFYVDDSPEAQRIIEVDGHRFHALIDMAYNKRDGHFYSSKPPVLTLLLAAPVAGLHALGVPVSFTGAGSALALVLLTWAFIGLASAAAFYAFRLQGRRAGGAADPGGPAYALHPRRDAVPVLLRHCEPPCPSRRRHPGRLLPDGHGRREPPGAGRPRRPGRVPHGAGHGDRRRLRHRLRRSPSASTSSSTCVPGARWSSSGSAAPRCWPRTARCRYSIWGSFLPVQMIAGTRDYAFNYWQHPLGVDAVQIPRSTYWLLTLFSMRGLFVLSPILLVGAAGLGADVAEGARAGRGYVALSVLFGIVFLVLYVGFLTPTNFGGDCFGMRYYVGLMPLLAFYALRAWSRWNTSRAFRVIFYALGVISLLYAVLGMSYTWSPMDELTHPLVRLLLPLRGY